MSYNKDAYFAHEQRKLEPTDAIICGEIYKKVSTLFEKWKWIDSLTPQQRADLKQDYENEKKRYELD
jgi:hypothetical protein